MLPDSLRRLFDTAEMRHLPNDAEFNPALAELVHANVAQSNLMRTTKAHFARRSGINLVDFDVLLEVVCSSDANTTVTPGYISEHLALSASTLTSILERLVEHGLLLRERDSSDKRRIAVKYTQKAARIVVDYYCATGQIYSAVFADEESISDAQTITTKFEEANRSLYESLRDSIL